MKCSLCKKRNAVINYANSVMEFTHGYTVSICRECYIDVLEDSLKDIKTNLKKQKQLLKNESK